jgi:hypothetical protein
MQDDAVDCSKIKPKGARFALAGIIDVARLCGDDYTDGMLSLNPVRGQSHSTHLRGFLSPSLTRVRGRLTLRRQSDAALRGGA